MMTLAPVVLFVYNRPYHLARVLESLRQNPEARDTSLIVFSDGPRDERDRVAVEAVRGVVHEARGFGTVQVCSSPINRGLSRSIIHGVTEVLQQHDRVIVLEDDLVVSPSFLGFMNRGLQEFAADERVAAVHAYMYPIRDRLPDVFFLPMTDCLGWGTWRRAWALFEPDGKVLLDRIHRQGLAHEFDLGGAYPFVRMLRRQVEGKNDSWAIRWYASMFLAGKLGLFPGRSYVNHIGGDGSGTHCGLFSEIEVECLCEQVSFEVRSVQPDPVARAIVAKYLRSLRWRRLLRRIWSRCHL